MEEEEKDAKELIKKLFKPQREVLLIDSGMARDLFDILRKRRLKRQREVIKRLEKAFPDA